MNLNNTEQLRKDLFQMSKLMQRSANNLGTLLNEAKKDFSEEELKSVESQLGNANEMMEKVKSDLQEAKTKLGI